MRPLQTLCVLCAVLVGAGCTPPVDPPGGSGPPPDDVLLAAGGGKPGAEVEYFLYSIRTGDSLYRLERRFKVPWREIAETNGVDPAALRINQTLLIRQVEGVEPPKFKLTAQDIIDSPRAVGKAARRPVAPPALHRGKPSSALWWPTSGKLIWHFGAKVRGFAEPGIGIDAPAGTEVCAVTAGTVKTVVPGGTAGAWGNVVTVAHAGGLVSWYAHLDGILVRRGQKLRRGEPLGTVGASGAATRAQLAFRLFKNQRPVNPTHYLP
jgi:murein DD-endopeptidase MepM/ murein hydrolase activator NlpD